MKSVVFEESQIFNIKRTCSSTKSRMRIHLPSQLVGKLLDSFDFEIICKPSAQLPTLDMILENVNNYRTYRSFFLKNRIPPQVFSFKFQEIFQLATLFETTLGHR